MEDDNFNATNLLDLERTSSRNCSKNSQNASPTRFSPFELKNNTSTTIFDLENDENLPPERPSSSNSCGFPKGFTMANTDTEMQKVDAEHLSCSLLKPSPLQHPKQMKKNVHSLIYSPKRKEDAQHMFFLHQLEDQK